MPLGLIGSIFSSAIGASSQDSANSANLRINQMNNAFNERMMEKQYQYSKEQFEREKALEQSQWERDTKYNSASAQVERFRQAGLNPNIMMKGQSAGMAQSGSVGGQSVGAASSSGNAVMNAFTPHIDGSSLSNTILGFLNYRKDKEAQNIVNEGLRIDNQHKVARIFQELAESKSRELSNKATANLNKTIESLQHQIVRNQTVTADSNALDARTNAMMRFSETLLNMKQLEHFDEKHKADMALSAAHTLLLCAERGLTQQQTRKEVYNTIVSQYQAAQGKADYRLSERLTDDIIDKWNWELKLLERQYNLMPYDKGGSILNGLFNTATQGIVGYGLLRGMGKVPPIRGFGR